MNALHIALFAFLAQAPPQALVQGVVLKGGGGGPISGARVELIRTDGTTPQSYSSITSADGSFIIPNARPGQYRLAASRSGFLRREFGQRSRNGFGLTMNLEASQQLRNLEIELRPAAAISGRVTDREGSPMTTAEVTAMAPAYPSGQRTLRVVQSTFTNDLGEYRLFGLSAGQYYVSVAPTEEGPRLFTTLIVSPSPQDRISFPGAEAARPRATVYYPSTTDSRFATPIDLTSGGDFGGVNITYVPLNPHHIRGNIPGGMANVTLVPADPALIASIQKADASDGPFDFSSVASGEYALVARSREMLGTASVSVGDGDLDNVTVGVGPTVSVPTHVSFEDRTTGENDPDLEAVFFTLLADPPIPGADPDVYGPFSNGFLAFGVVLRKDYRITLNRVRSETSAARLRDVFIQSIRMGNQDVLKDGFRVDDPDKLPQLEIVLGLRSGTLTGRVASEKQKSEANATVVLVPDAGRRRWPESFLTVTTDISGNYTIGRIPPGDYIAFSWEEVEEGAWMDPEFIKRYEEHGKRIHVNSGTNQPLSITAIP